MEDDKQFLKYLSSQNLSWLDDLDQECIFRDTGNLLTIKMDQDGVTGQPNVDNTLQYDPNVSNFDYSNRMMQFGANDTTLTGAISTAQPSVIPDSYNYNNFLPNDGFYTDPSLAQSHVPLKSSQQPYCVDVNNTVHSEDSYSNTSEPQLCIDITGNSANLTQESNQYTLSNDVDMKDSFFHEEKHLMNDDYASSQLSMNPIPQDANASINNDFSQINSQNELYYGADIAPSAINTDHGTDHDKKFMDVVPNIKEDSKPHTNVEAPIEILDDFEDNTKPEPTSEVKEEFKNEEVDLDTIQEPAPVQSSLDVANKSNEAGNQNTSDSVDHPIANGVDKTNTEEEICEIQMCIRNGCVNRAINNPEWEQEFCSNECVIIHCRNVFTSWVKGNEITA